MSKYVFLASLSVASPSPQPNPPIQRRQEAQQKPPPLPPPPLPLDLERLRTQALQLRLTGETQRATWNQMLPPLPQYLKRLPQRLLASPGTWNPWPLPQTPSLLHLSPQAMGQGEVRLLLILRTMLQLQGKRLLKIKPQRSLPISTLLQRTLPSQRERQTAAPGQRNREEQVGRERKRRKEKQTLLWRTAQGIN